MSSPSLSELLREARKSGASDLYLGEGISPQVRIDGELTPLLSHPVKIEENLLREIVPPDKLSLFQKGQDLDFSLWREEGGYRVNIYRDRRGIQFTFRIIPSRIPTLNELGFPEAVKKLSSLHQGLVLVTGPAGSGKSTTLASIIQEINRTSSRHIITVEDPIEFIHENQRSRIVQREVGTHTHSFQKALHSALRQDPDVIMIGELRDRETTSLALIAAETGHLVLSTLHTFRAHEAVDRIINLFPPHEQSQVRVMLSEILQGVISQHLVKKKEGGRVAVLEILVWTPALASLIREGKTFRIPSLMQTGKKKFGMRLFEDSYLELVAKGIIEEGIFRKFVEEKMEK